MVITTRKEWSEGSSLDDDRNDERLKETKEKKKKKKKMRKKRGKNRRVGGMPLYGASL